MDDPRARSSALWLLQTKLAARCEPDAPLDVAAAEPSMRAPEEASAEAEHALDASLVVPQHRAAGRPPGPQGRRRPRVADLVARLATPDDPHRRRRPRQSPAVDVGIGQSAGEERDREPHTQEHGVDADCRSEPGAEAPLDHATASGRELQHLHLALARSGHRENIRYGTDARRRVHPPDAPSVRYDWVGRGG